jgi:hypothetical protein
MLQGPVGQEAYKCVMTFCQQLGYEVVELNVQIDHIHLLVKIPPRRSISELMGVLKGRTAIRLFNVFPFLHKKPYRGDHFWARGAGLLRRDVSARPFLGLRRRLGYLLNRQLFRDRTVGALKS